MKRLLTVVVALFVFAALTGTALAQRNPRATSRLTLRGKTISVEYGRPSLKGRSVQQLLDQLKPGDVWRLGADRSTTFSTDTDLVFGSVTVPKGTYSLWARKEAGDSWQLVFNKQHGQWGTEYDAAQDLVAVPFAERETKVPKAAEMLTLALAKAKGGGVLTLQWGDMKLSANFTAK